MDKWKIESSSEGRIVLRKIGADDGGGLPPLLDAALNWASGHWTCLAVMAGILLLCIIIGVLTRKPKKPRLKGFLVVLILLGLAGGAVYFAPRLGLFKGGLPGPLQGLFQKAGGAGAAYVAAEALNVRSGPSIKHKVIGRLPKNAKVEVLNDKNRWYKVRSGNLEGYVNSHYLRH
ncbi:MAG: SH3 domain-containing protein [Treponematales bacterium]